MSLCKRAFFLLLQRSCRKSGLREFSVTTTSASPMSMNWSRNRSRNLRGAEFNSCDSSNMNILSSTGSTKCIKRKKSGGSVRRLFFRQLLDYKSYTYTYLLADPESRAAVVIDPVVDMVDRDVGLIQDLRFDLKFAVNTHVHADHITGTGEIKKRIATCQSVIAKISNAKADRYIEEGDTIKFGDYALDCYSTPGHTNGCMSFVLRKEGLVFTGDALLIRGCGRTDFQQGNAGVLYDSVHKKILSLPRHFKVYPAHDYTGQTSSTVGEELQFNLRLTRSKEQFLEVMEQLILPYPKQMEKSLPANMVCGIWDVPSS